MFKKCILHIGTEKTGTTSIQALLQENRPALAKQGFFVPRQMGRREHVDLVNMIVSSGKKFSRRAKQKLATPEQVDAKREQLEAAIRAELQSAADANTTLVISSERLFSMVTLKQEITMLRDLLGDYCSDIEIVCYLRPQHQFATSLYNTLLRNGINRNSPLPDTENPSRERRKFNYNHVLSFWKKHFPKATITVRRFNRKDMIGGDVVLDFASAASIETAGLLLPKLKNESLNDNALRILRAFNHFGPRFFKNETDAKRRELIQFLEKRFSGKGNPVSKAQQKAFFQSYSDSNQGVVDKFIRDGKPLFNDPFVK